MEDKIKSIFIKVLKLDLKLENFDVNLKYKDNNWDSINHLRIILEIEKEFNIQIPQNEIPFILSYKEVLKHINKNAI
jgi:acyl carrier protein|tara:strand:+ start:1646 stop:1876 length:231 start_codon:yes stop_codon:yes gene_type:complete